MRDRGRSCRVEYGFTAAMETDLDRIAGGGLAWRGMLKRFWDGFHPALEEAGALERATIRKAVEDRLEGFLFGSGSGRRRCPSCGDGELELRLSRHGPFVGCAGYETRSDGGRLRRGGTCTRRRGGTRGWVHRGDRRAAVGRGGGEDLVVRQFHGARQGSAYGPQSQEGRAGGDPAAPRRGVPALGETEGAGSQRCWATRGKTRRSAGADAAIIGLEFGTGQRR